MNEKIYYDGFVFSTKKELCMYKYIEMIEFTNEMEINVSRETFNEMLMRYMKEVVYDNVDCNVMINIEEIIKLMMTDEVEREMLFEFVVEND